MASSRSGQARKTVSVLFCDVTGSTALGERLDPETLREVIGRYFDEMRAVIERHGGTIEKFIGDAVMAVFGVPRVREDDALRAVRAAADMQSALAAANAGLEKEFGTRIQARIGVHTGEVIAGDPASGESFVSGDAVNIAARLEQAAEPGEVLIGEPTYRLVRAAVIAEPLEPLTLKGKSEPVPAYRVVVVESGAEMLPRRLDAPLVGRDRELGALRATYEEVAGSSECRLVTVIGEAGLGKSRLAHELLTSVAERARVLRGRCLPYGDGITFWPLIEILESAAGVDSTESPEEACAKVERLLPEEQEPLGRRLSALLSGGSAGAIQETFLAVRRWLANLAGDGPVVVLFDDIQWAEEAFLDLVEYLATFVGPHPLLLMCLARPELLEVRPDWVGTTIRLEPLEERSGQEMVSNLLGMHGIPEEVVRAIVPAAAGNPLFIEEMLRMLVDQGSIQRVDGRWVVAGDLSVVGAPDTVQAVIAARLDRLDPAERTVLQHAAVVGEVFWWGAVADLTEDASPVETGRRLQALLRKDLIRPDASSFHGEDSFRFGHLLIRDVAYESLPKKTRAGLHERFAGWLLERAGDRSAEYDEIIGYHAERAFRYLSELAPTDERATRLATLAALRLTAAGERAYLRGDASGARNLLARSAALRPADDPSRYHVLRSLGAVLIENGRLDEAKVALEEAIEGSRRLGDRRNELRSAMRLLYVDLHSTTDLTHSDALETAEPARAEFERLSDDAGLAETLMIFAMIHIWAGRCEDAIAVSERVVDHARRAADRRLELDGLHWMLLAICVGATPAEEGIPRTRALLEQSGNDRLIWLTSRRFLGEFEAMRGHFDEARALVREGTDGAREMGMESELGSGQFRASAYIEFLAGDLAAAERDLRAAVEILERQGDKGHLASVAPDLALVLIAGEREREALPFIELAEASMIEDDVDAQVRARAAKSIVLCRRGDTDAAERLARDAVARAWVTDYSVLRALSLEALAEVLHAAGRSAEAADALSRAITTHEKKGNIVSAEADRRLLAERLATRTR
jgi:class 3 adenylate cyclase/tetratricopeptide (TPR) repeat protein